MFQQHVSLGEAKEEEEKEAVKKVVQVDPPALLGRRQRIEEFRQFVEAKRKDKGHRQLVALYCLQTGLSKGIVEGYLKLFIEANVYVKPGWITDGKLLTPEEYKPLYEAYEQRQAELKRQREAEESYF